MKLASRAPERKALRKVTANNNFITAEYFIPIVSIFSYPYQETN